MTIITGNETGPPGASSPGPGTAQEPPELPAGEAAAVEQLQPPCLHVERSRWRAEEGETVTISVRLTGGPATALCWSRGSQDLAADDRYRLAENNNFVQLAVQRARPDDSGLYTLLAKNAAGEARATLELQVEGRSPAKRRREDGVTGEGSPPTFVRSLNDLAVKVGTRTRLLVELRGASNVTWLHEDVETGDGGGRLVPQNEGNFFCLDVSPVVAEDGGLWTCRAFSETGREVECSCYLNVLVPKAYKPPEFVEELRALLTEQGTVSLECKVVGVPTPVLRWFKDGREIRAGDVFALTASLDDPTSLGTYTCEASNCMGKTYSSSRVHVLGASKSSSASSESLCPAGPPPLFIEELRNEKAKLGDPLSLTCRVRVPPWPKEVAWYNSQGRVDTIASGGTGSSTSIAPDKYRAIEDGLGRFSLQISGIDLVDQGEWKCVVTSQEGVKSMTHASISVTVPKNYRKPRFLDPLKAILTEEGLVSFECKVVGFPTPQLRWFKDGQELRPGDVYQLSGTNSLGSYSCIAQNCMGEASSGAELTLEDIQSQLSDEERRQLLAANQPPRFVRGLKSAEARILEPHRLTIQVTVSPEPRVAWYRDDELVESGGRYVASRDNAATYSLTVERLEIADQAEWKCIATNDFGQSVTSCFLKLIIPRHFKKPRFLENLRAILSEEGAVNLECKVIGVPQPQLKWYKDGVELKPGDIHRIISGQDGSCCLGTYTCEASNCMGVVASSASLLGFEERMSKNALDSTRKMAQQLQPLATLGTSGAAAAGGDHRIARDPSLSTIHEERTSQMVDHGDRSIANTIADEERAEVSFSFDGREVSVSLYETPDLTEEEALQIVEMYAEELSEHVSEHNIVELPSLRFVKETSTSGKLVMEAVVIDVTDEAFETALAANASADDERTDADLDNLSITDEIPDGVLPQDKLTTDFLERAFSPPSQKDEADNIPKPPPRSHKKPMTPVQQHIPEDNIKSSDDSFYSMAQKENESAASGIKSVTESINETFASAKSDVSENKKKKKGEPAFQVAAMEIEQAQETNSKEESISESKRRKTSRSRSSSIERKKKSRSKQSQSPILKSGNVSPLMASQEQTKITIFGEAPTEYEKTQLALFASKANACEKVLRFLSENKLETPVQILSAEKDLCHGLKIIENVTMAEVLDEKLEENSVLSYLDEAKISFAKALEKIEYVQSSEAIVYLQIAKSFEQAVQLMEKHISTQAEQLNTDDIDSSVLLEEASEKFTYALSECAEEKLKYHTSESLKCNEEIQLLKCDFASMEKELILESGNIPKHKNVNFEGNAKLLSAVNCIQDGLSLMSNENTVECVAKLREGQSNIDECLSLELKDIEEKATPIKFAMVTIEKAITNCANVQISNAISSSLKTVHESFVNQNVQNAPEVTKHLENKREIKQASQKIIESSLELQKGLAMIELEAALEFSSENSNISRLACSAQKLQTELTKIKDDVVENTNNVALLQNIATSSQIFQDELLSTQNTPGILSKTFNALIETTKEFCNDVAQAIQDVIINSDEIIIPETNVNPFETLQRGLLEVTEQLDYDSRDLHASQNIYTQSSSNLKKQLSEESPLQALAESTRQLHKAVIEKQSSIESEQSLDAATSNKLEILSQCNKTFEKALMLIDQHSIIETARTEEQPSMALAIAQCSHDLHNAIEMIENEAQKENLSGKEEDEISDLQTLAESARELQFALLQVEEKYSLTIPEIKEKTEILKATEVKERKEIHICENIEENIFEPEEELSVSQQEETSFVENLALSANDMQRELKILSDDFANAAQYTEEECKKKLNEIKAKAKLFHEGLQLVENQALVSTEDTGLKEQQIVKVEALAKAKLSFEDGLHIIHSSETNEIQTSNIDALKLCTSKFSQGLQCIAESVFEGNACENLYNIAEVNVHVDEQAVTSKSKTECLPSKIDENVLKTLATTLHEMIENVSCTEGESSEEKSDEHVRSSSQAYSQSKMHFSRSLEIIEKELAQLNSMDVDTRRDMCHEMELALEEIQLGVAVIEEYVVWELDTGAMNSSIPIEQLSKLVQLTHEIKVEANPVEEQVKDEIHFVTELQDQIVQESLHATELQEIAIKESVHAKELQESLQFGIADSTKVESKILQLTNENKEKIVEQIEPIIDENECQIATNIVKELKNVAEILEDVNIVQTEQLENLPKAHETGIISYSEHELSTMSSKTDISDLATLAHSVEEFSRGVATVVQQEGLEADVLSLSDMTSVSKLQALAETARTFYENLAQVEEKTVLEEAENLLPVTVKNAVAECKQSFERGIAIIEKTLLLEKLGTSFSESNEISKLEALAKSAHEFQHGLQVIEQQVLLDAECKSMSDKDAASKLITIAGNVQELQKDLAVMEQNVPMEVTENIKEVMVMQREIAKILNIDTSLVKGMEEYCKVYEPYSEPSSVAEVASISEESIGHGVDKFENKDDVQLQVCGDDDDDMEKLIDHQLSNNSDVFAMLQQELQDQPIVECAKENQGIDIPIEEVFKNSDLVRPKENIVIASDTPFQVGAEEERKAKEEEHKSKDLEDKQKQEAKEKKNAEEAERKKKELEEKQKLETEEKKKAEEAERKKKELEEKQKIEAEEKKKAEEAERKKKELEEKQKLEAEEAERKKKELEEKQKLETEEKKKAEEAERKKKELEEKQKLEAEEKKKAEEPECKRKELEDKQKLEAEETKKAEEAERNQATDKKISAVNEENLVIMETKLATRNLESTTNEKSTPKELTSESSEAQLQKAEYTKKEEETKLKTKKEEAEKRETEDKKKTDQDRANKELEEKQKREAEEKKKAEEAEQKKKELEEKLKLEKEKAEEAERKRKELEDKQKHEAEEKNKAEEAERKKKELEEKQKLEAQEKKKAEEAERKKKELKDKQKVEAEEKKKAEEAERKKKELEDKQKVEAEEKKKAEETERKKKELEEKQKLEAEEKKKAEEAERKKKELEEEQKLEAEEKERAEEAERKKKELEEKKKLEAEEKKKAEEAELKKKELEEEQKLEAQEKKNAEEAERKMKELEEKKKLEAEEKKKAEEVERKNKELEEKQKLEAEEKKKAEEAERKKKELEEKKKLEAEEKKKAEEVERKKKELEEKQKLEAEEAERKKKELEEKQKVEAEEKKKAEEAERKKKELEEKKKLEAEEKKKAEEVERKKKELEEKQKLEAEEAERKKKELEEKQKLEAEEKKKAEEAERKKNELEEKKKFEAEEKKKAEEAERKKKELKDKQKVEAEEKKKAEEAERKKKELEEKQKLEAEEKKKAEEAERKKKELEGKQKVETEEKKKAEEAERKKKELDEKQKLEAEEKKKAEEADRKKKELEEKQKLEAEEKKKVEEAERKKKELEEKQQLEAEEKKKAEEAERKKKELEEKKKAEEAECKKKELEEKQKLEAEEAERKKKELEEKQEVEAEEKKKAEEAECKKKELEDKQKVETEEKKKAEEAERKKKELEEKQKLEAEEKKKAEEAEREKKELEEKKKAEEADRKKKELEEKQKLEAEEKKKAEEAERKKKELEEKQKLEAEEKKKAEEAERKKKELEEKQKLETEEKKKAEEAEREKKELEEKKKAEEADRKKKELEEKQKLEAEEKKKAEEAERKKKELEEKQKLEAEEKKKAEEAERKKKELEEKQKLETEEKKKAEEAERKKKELEEKQKLEAEEKKKAEEAERKKKELEEKQKLEAEEKKKAEEAERKKKELEEKQKLETEEKKKAEEAERKKKELEAKKKAEEADRKKKELEEKQKLEAEEKKKAEEAERKKKELEEKQKLEAEEAERKKKELEDKQKVEAEEKKKADEAERKKKELEEKQKLEAEEKKKAEEAERKEKELEEKQKLETEEKKKAEEAERKKKELEEKKKAEKAERKKKELEEKQKLEAEEKKKAEEAERKKKELEEKQKLETEEKKEAERKTKELEEKQKLEAEEKKKAEEAERKKKELEEKKKAEEAERKKKELEEKQKIEAEEKKKAEEAERKKKQLEEKQKLEAEEAERKKKELEDKQKVEAEEKKKAEEAERKKKEIEEKKKLEAEEKKKAEEAERKKKELEDKQKAEEAERKKKELEEKQKLEAVEKKKAEEAESKKKELEEKQKLEAEEKNKAEEAERKKKELGEKQKLETEEKKKTEDNERKKKDIVETKRMSKSKKSTVAVEKVEATNGQDLKTKSISQDIENEKSNEIETNKSENNVSPKKKSSKKLKSEKDSLAQDVNAKSVEADEKVVDDSKVMTYSATTTTRQVSKEKMTQDKPVENSQARSTKSSALESSTKVTEKTQMVIDKEIIPDESNQTAVKQSGKARDAADTKTADDTKTDHKSEHITDYHHHRKPQFCTRLTDRTAEEGSKIKLTCSVLGIPDPTVEWKCKDQIIKPRSSPRIVMSYNDNLATLEIRDTKIEDSGEYSCIARNELGEAITTATLKIYKGYEPEPYVPTFTRSIKDVYHPHNDELVLECRLRLNDTPSVTWLKDGIPMVPNDRIQQEVVPDPMGGGALSCRLILASPVATDSGHYICRAATDTWSDHISADVVFRGRERSVRHTPASLRLSEDDIVHVREGKPRITSGLKDHEVPAGATIELQVEIKGVPKPDVVWLHDNAAVPPSPKIRTFEEKGLYTLTVVNASPAEAGLYTCRAFNPYGRSDTHGSVRVIPRSGRLDKPAMFAERPDTTQGVAVGEDIVISFRICGEPRPQVTWMKGTRDITSSQRVLKETVNDYVRLTLKRALASDAGTYCILARNLYGCDRTFVTVRVRQRARSLTPTPDCTQNETANLLRDIRDQKEERALRDVPGPVGSEPTVTESGRSWLTLTWQKPKAKDAAPVIAYRVDAWLIGGGATWEELGITPINSFDAFSLKAGGEYKFRVTPRNRYGWGESVTTSETFTVGRRVELPEFVRILPGQQKVLHATDVRLECEVRAQPSAEVRWYLDGAPIENIASKRRITYDGARCVLTIKNVQFEDSGRYMCEASNKAGRVSTFARLLVVSDPKIMEADEKLRKSLMEEGPLSDSAPHFSMRLRDRRVQLTYPVRLTCQVTGQPIPKVTWHKDGEAIKLGDRYVASSSELFHTLELSNAREEDSGVYSATACNELGGVSCRCRLVVDKGIRAYIAPVFLTALEDTDVKANAEIRLMAHVEAYPAVGITWHRDGIRLRPSRRIEMSLDHEGHVELVVTGAAARDSGVYTCTAVNEVGRAECSARIDVIAPQEKKQPPQIHLQDLYSKEPRFVTKPRSSEAVEGDTVIILCEVIGDPKPEVWWLRDFLRPDYYRDAPHFRRVGDGPEYRLEIPCAKLDYTGAYSVIARNCHGEAKAVISLQIYAKGLEEFNRDQHRPVTHSKVQTLPSITRPLRDRRCCDGDAVTFECGVNAIPDPDVRWEKDGRLVPLGGDLVAESDGATARLTILQVYPEDEGEYTCVAYNELGRAATAACLIVDVPEEKEALLSGQLSRPPGLMLSAGSTPRSTPRTTPSRSKSPSLTRRARSTTDFVDATARRPRLKVVPPKFYAIPHNKVVEEGASVRFQCAIAGHPTPWVTWDKDGLLVTPSRRLTIKEKDDLRILELEEVTVEDAGLYRVTLENDVGRVESSARLDVIGPVGQRRGVRAYSASPSRTSPSFHRRLAHTAGRYGSRVTLACDLRGSPAPSPAWYRNGEQLMACERISATFDGEQARLTISSLRPSDAGEYSCEARSEAGSARCSARLEVIGVPDHMPAPTFAPGLVDTEARDGQALELHVRLQGSLPPDLEVAWLRQGRRLPNCEDFQYLSLGEGRFALRIADVFPQDAGVITFEARGLFGCVTSTARLRVKEETEASQQQPQQQQQQSMQHHHHPPPLAATKMPKVNGSSTELVNGKGIMAAHVHEDDDETEEIPARVLVGPSDVTALRGDCVTLRAKYAGCPEPTVRWLRAGREVRPEAGRVDIVTRNGESTLTLSCITADDSGKYVVAATNAIGSHCHFASLAVEGPPDPPSGRPSVVVSGTTSAVVAWGSSPYDGGRKVASYRVEIRALNSEIWTVVVEGCNSLSHTLKDLVSGQQYVVRVCSSNVHGLSEPGQESAPFTPGAIAARLSSSSDEEEEPETTDEALTNAGAVTVEKEENAFTTRYQLHEELGKGRFGVVYRVTQAASGHRRAAKFVRCIKAKDREKVYEEIEIMNCLRHPKLLQLESAFESAREIIMVMEYISGGELFERVVADDFTLTERDCILFMRQICEGVQYMHTQNIVHLDLKPENIMCRTRTSHHIKLIDFGLAKRLGGDEPVRVLFGTPEFVPPEVINYEPISVASDMWSVGVICYVLLSGLSPFMGDNDAETFANTTRADFDFDDEAFDAISQAAKDFISALLVQRQEKRMTASQCLKHPWLAQQDRTMQTVKLSTDKLKKFIIRRKWQKTGNAIRALGRMANFVSARRNSSNSSSNSSVQSRPSCCSRLTSLNEEHALELNGSDSADESKQLQEQLLMRKVRAFSDRSDSGFSESSQAPSREQSFDSNYSSSRHSSLGHISGPIKSVRLRDHSSVDSGVQDVSTTAEPLAEVQQQQQPVRSTNSFIKTILKR